MDPILCTIWQSHPELNLRGLALWNTYILLYRQAFARSISINELELLPSLALELEAEAKELNPKLANLLLFHQIHHMADTIRNLGMSNLSLSLSLSLSRQALGSLSHLVEQQVH